MNIIQIFEDDFIVTKTISFVRVSLCLYLLLFFGIQTWPEYPAGVLLETYTPVGVFKYLPGPLSDSVLVCLQVIWCALLLIGALGYYKRVVLFLAFVIGLYVLGYDYNFGRVFHGTSLALQTLLLFALLQENKNQKYNLLALQLLAVSPYFISGLSKFFKSGFDWFLTNNLAVILAKMPTLNGLNTFLLNQNDFILKLIAASVFFFELLAPVFLINSVLRITFFVFVVFMHLGIFLITGGHSAFFSHIPILLALVIPTVFKKRL
jgi:hypothetical protein